MRLVFYRTVVGVLLLTASTTAVTLAQSPNSTQSTTQVVAGPERRDEDRSAQEHKSPEPPSAARVRAASTEKGEKHEQALVVPPAPNVTKKAASSIAIPSAAATGAPRYEERVASASVSIGSDFGYRRDPFTRRAKFHSGVDIHAKLGDSVGASCGGVVQYAGWYHGYGNIVIVDHGGGITTHYAHLSSFDVEVGDRVERGTIVGRAGSTGRATSPHLHYEVRVDGSAVHPLQVLVLDASSPFFKQSQPVTRAQSAEPAPPEPAKQPLKAN